METKFRIKKGQLLSMGILIAVGAIMGYVLAQSPTTQWHPPGEIPPGTFQTGAYIFPGDLEVSGTTDLNGNVELPTSGISGAGAGSGLNADKLTGEHKEYFQKRITDTCSSESSIRSINADGSVVCEEDDSGGSGGADGCIDYFIGTPTRSYFSCDSACGSINYRVELADKMYVYGRCILSRDIGSGVSNCDGSSSDSPDYAYSQRVCICCHHADEVRYQGYDND
jgi:hypothetical protein